MLAVALCLEHDGKWRYELLASILFALCINTRVIGIMFPVLLLGYRLIRDWLLEGRIKANPARWIKKDLARYALNVLLMFGVYFLITPASWENPLDYLKNVLVTFSNYTTWGGQVPFLDQMYPGSKLPPHYLLTWVGISVPLWYLLCMGIGLADGAKQGIDHIRKRKMDGWLLGEQRYLLFCLVVAAAPLLLPFVKQVTLYNSWRHMYFVFPALVVLALFGLRAVFHRIGSGKHLRMAAAGAVCLLLMTQVGWIVINRPYEKVYFNPVGRQVADTVDRDYWAESAVHPLEVILENDDTDRISISSDWIIGITVFHFLPEEQSNRFYVYYNGAQDVDYFIDSADTVDPQTFDGYTPVYEHRMKDGLVLSTILIRDDLLQSRFGGVYPANNLD